MTKDSMREKLVNCFINFNQTELKGACNNTQLQITRFFQNIMRELDQMILEEDNK